MKGKNRKELSEILAKTRKGPLEDQLVDYFDKGDFQEDPTLDIYALADQWQVDRREMLDCFLQLVGLGLCDLNWHFHCPHCGAVAHETIALHNAHEEDHCAMCQVDFKNTLDQNVEVQFSIHGTPSKKAMQRKETMMKQMMEQIKEGKSVEWKMDSTITGADCLHNYHFREFLGEDLLDLTQSLAISTATILFTDIKGSTALYETLGDARAYRLVRDHFNILFHETERNNGAVVKTIGDAVMSSFAHPLDAMRTALAMQKAIASYNKGKEQDQWLEIKVGLHSGPAIVVTLNNRLDYFGGSVNRAARIQGEAQAGEIIVSQEVFQLPEVQNEIKLHVTKVMKRRASLKGIEDHMELYRIPLLSN